MLFRSWLHFCKTKLVAIRDWFELTHEQGGQRDRPDSARLLFFIIRILYASCKFAQISQFIAIFGELIQIKPCPLSNLAIIFTLNDIFFDSDSDSYLYRLGFFVL